MKKFKVILLSTGGTISGKRNTDQKVYPTTDGTFLISELRKRKLDFDTKLGIEPIPIPLGDEGILSEEMIPYNWRDIAEKIVEEIKEGADAIIVLHGTDTMTYTSAALRFMLQNPPIPIILTGANFPPTDKNTDAYNNLYDSFVVASKSGFKGVYIVFGGMIYHGAKVRKIITPHKDEFGANHLKHKYNAIITGDSCYTSINIGKFGTGSYPIGFIKNEEIIPIEEKLINKEVSGEFAPRIKINPHVSLLKISPVFDPKIIDYSVDVLGIKGMILELYNSGTGNAGIAISSPKYDLSIPDRNYSLSGSVENARKKGVLIFATSQQVGIVDMNEYETSGKLKDAGYLFSWDDIPGNDNGRLIEFLKKRFCIDWVETAKIEKIDDGRTIRLSFKSNFLSLKLDDEKTMVSLEIDDGRTDEFIARTESGKLNIYDAGIIPLGDMTSEAAVAKLAWVLGHEKNLKRAEEIMLTNIAGEIDERWRKQWLKMPPQEITQEIR